MDRRFFRAVEIYQRDAETIERPGVLSLGLDDRLVAGRGRLPILLLVSFVCGVACVGRDRGRGSGLPVCNTYKKQDRDEKRDDLSLHNSFLCPAPATPCFVIDDTGGKSISYCAGLAAAVGFIAFSFSLQSPGSIVDAPFAIFHPASVRTRLN